MSFSLSNIQKQGETFDHMLGSQRKATAAGTGANEPLMTHMGIALSSLCRHHH